MGYKKSVGPSALRARQKVEELHEKLRRVGLVCIDCGEQKRYDEFPLGKTGRVTLTKPCTKCQKFKQKKLNAISRLCPACGEGRRPSAFHKSGLCLGCFDDQKKINQHLGKPCPVCQIQKKPSEFTPKGYCNDCASFLAVHECSLCQKGFQRVEMLLDEKICVYCAFERGTKEDVLALRALVRSDQISAIKMQDYMKKLLTLS